MYLLRKLVRNWYVDILWNELKTETRCDINYNNAQTTVKKALSEICGWCYIYIRSIEFDFYNMTLVDKEICVNNIDCFMNKLKWRRKMQEIINAFSDLISAIGAWLSINKDLILYDLIIAVIV